MKTFIIVLVSFLFFSCDNSTFVAEPFDPRLPILSSEGRNTIGAIVNGNAIATRNNSGISIDYRLDEDSLFLTIGSFQFKLVDDFPQERPLGSPLASYLSQKNYSLSNDNYGSYNLNGFSNQGTISFLTGDGVSNIIYGTFAFRDDEVTVRKGRFDVRLDDF